MNKEITETKTPLILGTSISLRPRYTRKVNKLLRDMSKRKEDPRILQKYSLKDLLLVA